MAGGCCIGQWSRPLGDDRMGSSSLTGPSIPQPTIFGDGTSAWVWVARLTPRARLISSQPCELGPEWKEGSVSEAGAESDLGRGTPIPQPTRRESHTEPKGGGVRVARSSIHVAKFTETLAFGHCASRWEPVKTHDSSEGVKPHSFPM